MELNGKCVILSERENNLPYKLTYKDAVGQCIFKGGKLFEPKNEIMSRLLVAYVSQRQKWISFFVHFLLILLSFAAFHIDN